MERKDFTCSIKVDLSAAEVIAKISKVPEWWGVAFTGVAEKQGDQFVVKMGGESFFNFTVDELVPEKKLVWLVTDCYMPWYANKTEWKDTRLIFELSAADGLTELTFTHQGLTPDVDCYKDCEPGWKHWINTSLLAYLTTGQGRLKKKINTIYTTQIELPYTPDVIFEKLNQVAQWWPEEFEGKSTALNDEFILRTGNVHVSKQRIIEFIPDEKVVWLTTESLRKTDNYDWTGTKIIYELSGQGANTLLKFTYDGPVFENEKERLAQECDRVIKNNLYNFITDPTWRK